jgi:hypothetical protein
MNMESGNAVLEFYKVSLEQRTATLASERARYNTDG